MKYLINIIFSTIATILFLSLFACEEEIIKTEGEPVTFEFQTRYKNLGNNCDNIAPSSTISINQYFKGVPKLIGEVETDEVGSASFTVPNSEFGVNNLVFTANYQNTTEYSTIDYECKDTTLAFCFDIFNSNDERITDCNQFPFETSVTFTNPDTGNECLIKDFPKGNIYYIETTSISNSSTNTIRINNLDVISQNNRNFGSSKFRTLLDNYTNNEIINIGSSFQIPFEVNTDQVGEFTECIDLNMDCLDANGNVLSSGIWTICLYACVEDLSCDCPYGTGNDRTIFTNNGEHISNTDVIPRAALGNTTDATLNLFSFDDIADDCVIELTSITRVNQNFEEYSATLTPTTNPASGSINHPLYNSWVINSPVIGATYSEGDDFITDVSLSPITSQKNNFLDTFRVEVSIRNTTTNAVTSNCSYYFILEGGECEVLGCPIITFIEAPTGSNAQLRDYQGVDNEDKWDGITGNFIRNINFEKSPTIEVFDATNNEEVYSRFNSYFSEFEACGTSLPDGYIHSFNISYGGISVPCEEDAEKIFTISAVETGESDWVIDRGRYIMSIDGVNVPFGTTLRMGANTASNIEVTFLPPTTAEYNSMGKGNDVTFNLRLEIQGVDNNCQQFINIQSLMDNGPSISPVRPFPAYSQNTTQNNPKYEALKIDKKNSTDMGWGATGEHRENNPLNEGPDVAETRPYLGQIDDGQDAFSIYLEVPIPDNAGGNSPYPQNPSLYLVHDPLNRFDRMTRYPIEEYLNQEEFEADLGNLRRRIFDNTQGPLLNGYTSPDWFNGSGAADPPGDGSGNFVGQNENYTNGRGVDLVANDSNSPNTGNTGEIYLVWSTKNTYTDAFSGEIWPCHAALIFIETVIDTDIKSSTKIAKVSVQIVYRLYK